MQRPWGQEGVPISPDGRRKRLKLKQRFCVPPILLYLLLLSDDKDIWL